MRFNTTLEAVLYAADLTRIDGYEVEGFGRDEASGGSGNLFVETADDERVEFAPDRVIAVDEFGRSCATDTRGEEHSFAFFSYRPLDAQDLRAPASASSCTREEK